MRRTCRTLGVSTAIDQLIGDARLSPRFLRPPATVPILASMTTYQIDERVLAESPTAVVRATVGVADMGAFVGPAIGAVAQALAGQAMAPAGRPFARFHPRGCQEFDVEAGFVTAAAITSAGRVQASSLPGGPAAVLTFLGPYAEMEPAYGALAEWVAQRGGHVAGDPWEVYFSDPAQQPDPHTWRTEIVMPFDV